MPRLPRSVPLFATACLLIAAACARADERIDFARDIRPILSDACFKCHGPDDGTREADLRLDGKDGLLGDRGGYAPFVPGQPGDSEAFRRITSPDETERMPPADSGKKLTAGQIDLIRRWIEQGAEWSEHWAFVAPKRPDVPAASQSGPAGPAGWLRNPLDAFIVARLEREGLAPAREADKVTLLRRLTLDLVGLPPAIEDVDDFLADDSPAAFEKQADRLLASVHYGERWGRHWLDAARYADSDGFEKDKQRRVWFYRDWVVDALNRDLPYDRFVVEQIAGDLLAAISVGQVSNLPGQVGRLPHPDAGQVGNLPHSQDQLVATGFLRNSMINEEGGVDPEQFRMEAMFDRMDAIGKSILGLTIQCAQCHNHKFDPLTQADYYRMFAFLNNAHEANVAAYTPDEELRRAEIFRRIREIEAGLRHRHPDWPERMAVWEDTVRGDQPEWTVVGPQLDASGGQKHYLLEDGSILAAGYAPTKHTTEFSIEADSERIAAVRLELLNDPNLPLGGPGRSIFGLCALTEFHVVAAPADRPHAKQEIKIVSATADVNPPEAELAEMFGDKTKRRRVTGPIAYAIDRKDETAWGLDIGPGRSNAARKAVFVFEKPVAFPGGAVLTFKLTQNHGGWNSDDNQNNNLGRFRFSITGAEGATADPLPARIREILAVARDQRTPAQTAAVFSYWRTTVPEWQAANDEIEALWRTHPAGSSQLVLTARDEPRTTRLLDRGNFLKPQDPVAPGVPSFLHPLPEGVAPDRLAFARWLVDPRSPTTARSLVNRVWQQYFGIGLVSTSEDLGRQSEPPSHPALLDWLAVEFGGVEGRESRVKSQTAGITDNGPRTTDATSPQPSTFNPQPSAWSLKRLHRLIVTSATYRQSSQVTHELLARDPYNRLLARGARFRVEAETVRDVALAASGLLNRRLRGPSVYPPAPDFLFVPPASYGPKVWNEDTGPDRYRRALYTFRYRSVPYPMLDAFDAPNGDASCVRRARSNTPLQALVTLNEPLFVESAAALADRMLREGGESDAERVEYGFRLCLGRRPTQQETELLLGLLERERQRDASQTSEVGGQTSEAGASTSGSGEFAPDSRLSTTDNGPPTTGTPLNPQPSSLNPQPEWSAVARVLLNLDETITKE